MVGDMEGESGMPRLNRKESPRRSPAKCVGRLNRVSVRKQSKARER